MSDKRRATRHDVDLGATLVARGTSHPVTISNLSHGGAQVVHREPLPLNERVTLRFCVSSQKEPIEVGATVRWCAGDRLGVQFDGLRAREVWSLNRYFESLG